MRDVLELLQAQRDAERLFVAEAAEKTDAPKSWSQAMVMFHLAQWRERLWDALADATEGRPVNAPPGDIDELNNARWPAPREYLSPMPLHVRMRG
jgi:hypothetical protein